MEIHLRESAQGKSSRSLLIKTLLVHSALCSTFAGPVVSLCSLNAEDVEPQRDAERWAWGSRSATSGSQYTLTWTDLLFVILNLLFVISTFNLQPKTAQQN